MRFLVIASLTLALAGACFAQAFEAQQAKPDPATIAVDLVYKPAADFVTESCYWHVYEKGKDPRHPKIFEGCKSISYTFPEGEHLVELVINGRDVRYLHLSLEQRTLRQLLTVQPRLKTQVASVPDKDE
jgi:hypothetical protein